MKKYILGAVLSLGILVSPLFASAAGLTSSQISAIMQLLQAFGADQSVISNVQVALTGGAPTTGGQSFCHNFSSDLTVGNGGNDVSALNQALTLSGIDTTSNTVSFTENTAGDVVSFQARYGIRQTGYVGPLTRGKLNALYGCGNNQVPAPTPLPIVPQPTPITPQPVQTPVTLAPIIQVVTPTSAAPGSTVTINGGTFDSSSYISIGNVPGGVNSRSITPNSVNSNGMALSFIIPSDMGAGTFPIYVAEKGTNFVSNSATLTVVVAKQSPTISSISPNQGTTAGTASIYGTNLTSGGNPTVEFHSSSGTLAGVVSFVNMNYISPQQLIFNLNATNATNGSSITLQPGVYQVDVLTPNGTSNPVLFTIAAPTISPVITSLASKGSGIITPGATIVVNGYNFDSNSLIELDGNQMLGITPVSYSSTSLVFVLPSSWSVGTHSIRVVQMKTSNVASNSVSFTVTATQQTTPTIASISSSQGTVNDTITIYGSNLTSGGNPSVEFYPPNGSTVPFTTVPFMSMQSISSQSITIPIANTALNNPALAMEGVWRIMVVTPTGRSNALPFTLTTGVSSASLVTCSVTQQTVPVYTNPFSISWSSTNSVYGMGPYGDKIDTQGSATYQLTAGQEKLYTFIFFNAAGQSTTCSTFFSSLKG